MKEAAVAFGLFTLFRSFFAPRTRLGVWWDEGGSATLAQAQAYIAACKELRITDVAIMATRQEDTTWRWSVWTPEQLELWCRMLRAAGIEPTIVVWPRPTRTWIEGALGGTVSSLPLAVVAARCGAAVEFDAEGGNWKSSLVSGYPSLTAASRALVDGVRDGLRRHGGGRLKVGATVHTGRLQRELTSLCDYVAIQAYSQAQDDDRDGRVDDGYDFGEPYGPGERQRLGARMVRGLGGPELVMGLAAYNQDFPGHSTSAAMLAAWNAAAAEGARRVRYWSMKWIIGRRGQHEVRDVLRRLPL